MIVAHANNRVIGKDNDMPWHLPADLAYFKKTTLGKPIVMGRKTYDSIGRPLPRRRNIVISRSADLTIDGVDVVNSVEQALALCADAEEVMVIGGGAIYQHCMASADRLYITHIDVSIDGDTYFPDYDLEHDWFETHREQFKADDMNSFDLAFCVYERR